MADRTWNCAVCNIPVPQTSGPIGMRCKTHKHWRQRNCPACATPFTAHKTRKYCSPDCIPKAEMRAPRTELQWRTCGHCGRWICRPGRKYCDKACAREAQLTNLGCRNRMCKRCNTALGEISLVNYCDTCRSQRNRETRLANKHKRRAAQRQTTIEPINPFEIYERDGWKCGICRRPVDRQLKYPDPKSASLDHIEALSLNGHHTKDNVQLAHWDCNVRKGNREPAQLRLIG